MRSSWWALYNLTGVLIRGDMGRDTCRRTSMWGHGEMTINKQTKASARTSPADILIPDFQTPGLRKRIHYVSPPVYGALLRNLGRLFCSH